MTNNLLLSLRYDGLTKDGMLRLTRRRFPQATPWIPHFQVDEMGRSLLFLEPPNISARLVGHVGLSLALIGFGSAFFGVPLAMWAALSTVGLCIMVYGWISSRTIAHRIKCFAKVEKSGSNTFFPLIVIYDSAVTFDGNVIPGRPCVFWNSSDDFLWLSTCSLEDLYKSVNDWPKWFDYSIVEERCTLLVRLGVTGASSS